MVFIGIKNSVFWAIVQKSPNHAVTIDDVGKGIEGQTGKASRSAEEDEHEQPHFLFTFIFFSIHKLYIYCRHSPFIAVCSWSQLQKYHQYELWKYSLKRKYF